MNRHRKIIVITALTSVSFRIFDKFGKSAEPDVLTAVEEDEIEFSKIRCPKCKWQPESKSRWFCSDCLEPEFYLEGCGAMWNTFESGGICPGCRHKWRWTSCLACADWSRHEDWYQGRIN